MQTELGIFRNLTHDFECEPERVDGTIPEALHGSLLRNGPGQQLVGNDRLHLLDGHSFVVAAHFRSGKLSVVGKHTDSAAHRAERGCTSQALRYVFTNRPGGWAKNLLRMNFANSAAHDVYAFGGKIHAADIFGHYALDPQTLDTLGPSALDVLLEKPNDQISPMPRIHSDGRTLSAYRFRPSVLGSDRVSVFDMAWDGTLSSPREHELQGSGNAIHDLAVTDTHDVVVRWGSLAPVPALLGTKAIGAAITLPPGQALVYLLPRSPNERSVVVRLPRQQIFHLFNAFRRDDELVLDVVAYDDGIDFTRVHPERYTSGAHTPPRVRRHAIALADGSVSTREYAASGEAPDIDQRRHGKISRYGYVAGVAEQGSSAVVRSAYFWSNAVLKVDFESGEVKRWQAPKGAFLSPPTFVANGAGEDDGFVMTWLCAADQSAVVVLDAQDLQRGPIATAWFKPALPGTSHTSWLSRS